MDHFEMLTFELFVHDDRYSVPTLHLVTCDDEAAACDAADGLLRASAHHHGVEVYRGGEQVVIMGVCAERQRTQLSPSAMRVASGG